MGMLLELLGRPRRKAVLREVAYEVRQRLRDAATHVEIQQQSRLLKDDLDWGSFPLVDLQRKHTSSRRCCMERAGRNRDEASTRLTCMRCLNVSSLSSARVLRWSRQPGLGSSGGITTGGSVLVAGRLMSATL